MLLSYTLLLTNIIVNRMCPGFSHSRMFWECCVLDWQWWCDVRYLGERGGWFCWEIVHYSSIGFIVLDSTSGWDTLLRGGCDVNSNVGPVPNWSNWSHMSNICKYFIHKGMKCAVIGMDCRLLALIVDVCIWSRGLYMEMSQLSWMRLQSIYIYCFLYSDSGI